MPKPHPTRRGGGVSLAATAALTLWLALSACSSDPTADRLGRLDVEAQRIIALQQQRTLGPLAAVEPPERTFLLNEDPDGRAVDDAYDREPPTANPPAAELDVSARPPAGTLSPPALLDDGTRPDTLRFDLEALLAYAIAHSPEYQLEREALFLQTLSLIIERHEWGPRFFSVVSGSITGDPEFGDTDTALSLIGSVGVSQRLPYGGTVSAAALVDYVTLLRESAASAGTDDTTNVDLELSLDLPLLRGAGRTAVTVEAAVQAERDLIYAVRDFERFRREFFVDLATTYFNLVTAQRQLANRELQLRNLESLAEQFIALAEAGRVPFFQAERAEQRALTVRSLLVNQQENYVSNLDALKLTIGVETTRPVEILPVEIDVPELVLDVDAAVATAQQLRLDLQTERDLVGDARRGVLIARNQLLPDLDLQADTSIDTSDDFGIIDFQPGDDDFSVSLALGLPLDRKIEYADYRAALIGLEQQNRGFLVERDRVALQVRNTARGIDQSRFQLQLQDRAVEINERRAIQVEIDQRNLGTREVIDAQEDLLDARDDRDEAIADLRISILQFLLASGQMRVGPGGQWLAPGTLRPADDTYPPPDPSATPYLDPAALPADGL
ncbi:MAG: TolC family protein [Planctomycetota bacterium]